jgi:hypothetical protein
MEFNSDRPTVVVVLTKLSIQFGVSAHLRLVTTTKIMHPTPAADGPAFRLLSYEVSNETHKDTDNFLVTV